MPKKKGTVRFSKYKAEKVVIDGFTFDSKKEGERYKALKVSEGIGEIRNLEVHKPFILELCNSKGEVIHTEKYESDFTYEVKETLMIPFAGNSELATFKWIGVVEDCKGFITPEYKRKKKLMKALYGIEIVET